MITIEPPTVPLSFYSPCSIYFLWEHLICHSIVQLHPNRSDGKHLPIGVKETHNPTLLICRTWESIFFLKYMQVSALFWGLRSFNRVVSASQVWMPVSLPSWLPRLLSLLLCPGNIIQFHEQETTLQQWSGAVDLVRNPRAQTYSLERNSRTGRALVRPRPAHLCLGAAAALRPRSQANAFDSLRLSIASSVASTLTGLDRSERHPHVALKHLQVQTNAYVIIKWAFHFRSRFFCIYLPLCQ